MDGCLSALRLSPRLFPLGRWVTLKRKACRSASLQRLPAKNAIHFERRTALPSGTLTQGSARGCDPCFVRHSEACCTTPGWQVTMAVQAGTMRSNARIAFVRPGRRSPACGAPTGIPVKIQDAIPDMHRNCPDIHSSPGKHLACARLRNPHQTRAPERRDASATWPACSQRQLSCHIRHGIRYALNPDMNHTSFAARRGHPSARSQTERTRT